MFSGSMAFLWRLCQTDNPLHIPVMEGFPFTSRSQPEFRICGQTETKSGRQTSAVLAQVMDGWIECAHKSLTSSATGLSPFKVPLGYKPRMFVGTDKSPPSPHKWTERTSRWPPCYSQGERRVVLLKSLSRTLRCKTKIAPGYTELFTCRS